MAAGALVPHVLPNGRTIMVPDYLAPGGGAAPLAMPQAPAPAGPDLRVAGPGGGGLADMGSADPMAAAAHMQSLQPSETESIRAALTPKAQAPSRNEHKAQPKGPDWMPRGEAKGGGAVDPSTLVAPRTGAPATAEGGSDSDGEWSPLVRRVFNEGGGGGGGPRRTGRREEASATAERIPGRDLIPELRWAYGLEDRPDLGQELDPDAQQPTWGNADPVTRARKTGLERGAEAAGASARLAFERQANEEQRRLNAERDVLAQQSQALDDNLNEVAARRQRIAALQETADKRMEEARNFEPRTRDQVWEDKGPAAQVMGILAMALGGYVQGLGRTGGRNPGLDMVNKVIDDAIEEDRYKAEKRTKVGQAARNDYEKALALYGDPEAAMLEAKQRKLANTMGMLNNQLAGRTLDEMAKQRGQEMYAAAQQQYLENAQQLYDRLHGVAVKESVSYKPEMAGGGGGGRMDTLARLERTARAKKAEDTILGREGKPEHAREISSEKLDLLTSSLDAIEASGAIKSQLKVLGNSSDVDDPTTGPIDSTFGMIPGTADRKARQILRQETFRLARAEQKAMGKSDKDADLAAEAAIGIGGSAWERDRQATETSKKMAARIQDTLSGVTPQQRDAYLNSLPPERRAAVMRALSMGTSQPRAASEKAVE